MRRTLLEESFNRMGCVEQSVDSLLTWRMYGRKRQPEERSATPPTFRSLSGAGGCVRGSVRHRALYQQKLQIFPFIASSGRSSQLVDHAHHNKRITRRLARAHCKQCVSGIPSLFMRDHIPEGFLLFAFQLFIFFLVTLKLFDSIDTCITGRIDYELFVSPFNRSIVLQSAFIVLRCELAVNAVFFFLKIWTNK